MKERSRPWSLAAFTLALALVASGAVAPSGARADRVVLYPVSGRADPDRLDELEDRFSDVIRGLGHTVLAPPGGLGASGGRPRGSAQLSGIATAANASYVVLAEIEPLRAQYRLHVIVGYQPASRVEEIVVTILQSEEEERLREVLAAMLRPEGLGEDAVRLTGGEDQTFQSPEEEDPDAAAQRAAEEEALRRQEEEEAARRAAAAEQERQEQLRAEEERWSRRRLYGSDGPWLMLLGVEGSCGIGLSRLPNGRDSGGGLALIQARAGRTVPGVDGLEIRLGVDAILGVVGGLDAVVGAVWQWTPSLEPLHIGIVLDVGASFLLTGARDVGFVIRGGAVASWAPTPHLQLELALPELGVITNGPGAFTVGASIRGGYRFD